MVRSSVVNMLLVVMFYDVSCMSTRYQTRKVKGQLRHMQGAFLYMIQDINNLPWPYSLQLYKEQTELVV